MKALADSLKERGVLKAPRAEAAFREIQRSDFVPREVSHLAGEDTALPIGWGQTISQPYTVAFMLDLLAPKPGGRIMEVGFGSGWQTALLASIVGTRGAVYGVELIPELCEFGKRNIAKYASLRSRVNLYCQNAAAGPPDVAAEVGGFDGVIAAAEVLEAPLAWRSQLKIGAKMVYPKAQSIILEIKAGMGDFEILQYPGFVFVPFIEPGSKG